MAIEVSEGTQADVEELRPLWISMVEHHRAIAGAIWPVRPTPQAWSRRRRQYLDRLADGTALLFLARDADSGQAVGYAACLLVQSGPTFDLGETFAEVDDLAVAEQQRGAGVGSQLLGACRQELLRRGFSYWAIGVVDGNHGADRLYARLGFRPFSHRLLAPLGG